MRLKLVTRGDRGTGDVQLEATEERQTVNKTPFLLDVWRGVGGNDGVEAGRRKRGRAPWTRADE